ncbi:hypothetical protein [Mycoplana rhizolycopersici]|uniref:Uncharacterized protein n=1 Tax=Mycoplana rhizolycopersici TaxID=2746702 RepID=A0ABX2Q9T6_9HYPH|nr:hypothetical protein [Rhizobium rhizolycopersici]NVP54489.1 hypothetical protein [Rhizobium rhizolycopersici]
MKTIACTPVAAIGDTRQLMITSMDGSTKVGTAKDGGALLADFTAGAFILADNDGQLIVGPIQIEAAQVLARRVAEGDPRATTEPQANLILATAVLALAHMWPRVLAAAAKGAV